MRSFEVSIIFLHLLSPQFIPNNHTNKYRRYFLLTGLVQSQSVHMRID